MLLSLHYINTQPSLKSWFGENSGVIHSIQPIVGNVLNNSSSFLLVYDARRLDDELFGDAYKLVKDSLFNPPQD